MPIYDFLCRECEHRFDDLVTSQAATEMACPTCDSGDVVRLYSPFSVRSSKGDVVMAGGGACMPGPAGAGGGGGCCGGGCGGCG